jgi:hypothetical protein
MRAKFRVSHIILDATGDIAVQLYPVTGNEENKRFWKWTPSGSLAMTITNPEASSFFEVGKEYYLDFTPADEAPTDGDSGLTEQEEQERDAYLLSQAIAEDRAIAEDDSDI